VSLPERTMGISLDMRPLRRRAAADTTAGLGVAVRMGGLVLVGADIMWIYRLSTPAT